MYQIVAFNMTIVEHQKSQHAAAVIISLSFYCFQYNLK